MPALVATEIWVSALIRRAQGAGANAVVVRRGDPTAGAVLVKVYDTRARTARLYAEALGGAEGERRWMQPHPDASEAELDAYAARQAGYDPDLWIVEIEDPQARPFLTEPVDEG
jgi:hypothetical protein